MAGWLDIADMVSVAVRDNFGQEVTIVQAATGTTATIEAPYDRTSLVLGSLGELELSGDNPRIQVRLADLEFVPEQGDEVSTPDGAEWTVKDVQPDGLGNATLILVEA